jgi:hypothetical protein
MTSCKFCAGAEVVVNRCALAPAVAAAAEVRTRCWEWRHVSAAATREFTTSCENKKIVC